MDSTNENMPEESIFDRDIDAIASTLEEIASDFKESSRVSASHERSNGRTPGGDGEALTSTSKSRFDDMTELISDEEEEGAAPNLREIIPLPDSPYAPETNAGGQDPRSDHHINGEKDGELQLDETVTGGDATAGTVGNDEELIDIPSFAGGDASPEITDSSKNQHDSVTADDLETLVEPNQEAEDDVLSAYVQPTMEEEDMSPEVGPTANLMMEMAMEEGDAVGSHGDAVGEDDDETLSAVSTEEAHEPDALGLPNNETVDEMLRGIGLETRTDSMNEHPYQQTHPRVDREESMEIEAPGTLRTHPLGTTSSIASASSGAGLMKSNPKGVRVCCVPSCKNYMRPAALVHLFPDSRQQPSRRRGWIVRINTVGLAGGTALTREMLEANPNWGVCGLHFGTVDYTALPEPKTGTRGTLKLNAAPSIFAKGFARKKLPQVNKVPVRTCCPCKEKGCTSTTRHTHVHMPPALPDPMGAPKQKSALAAALAPSSGVTRGPPLNHMYGRAFKRVAVPKRFPAPMAPSNTVAIAKGIPQKETSGVVTGLKRTLDAAGHDDENEGRGEFVGGDDYSEYAEPVAEEGAEEADVEDYDDDELVPVRTPLKLTLGKAPMAPFVQEEDDEPLHLRTPLKIVLQKMAPPLPPAPVKVPMATKPVQVDSDELEPDSSEEEIQEIMAEAQQEILDLKLTLESTELQLYNEKYKVTHLEARVAAWIREHFNTVAQETDRVEMMDKLASYYLARAKKAEEDTKGLSAEVELYKANFQRAQKEADAYRAQIIDLQGSTARQVEMVVSAKQKENKESMEIICTLRRQLAENAHASSQAKKAFETLLREYEIPIPDSIKNLDTLITVPKRQVTRKQLAKEAANAAVAPPALPNSSPAPASPNKNTTAQSQPAATATPTFNPRNTRQRAKEAAQPNQTPVIQSTPSGSAFSQPQFELADDSDYATPNPKKRTRAPRGKAVKPQDEEYVPTSAAKKPRESSVDRAVRYLMSL